MLRDVISQDRDRIVIQFVEEREMSIEMIALGGKMRATQPVEPIEACAVEFKRHHECGQVVHFRPMICRSDAHRIVSQCLSP